VHPALTLPNLLTVSRLILAPLVVWRIVELDLRGAFWLFAAAALTDLLDGFLARMLDQRSVLGAWLDPIADKVMLLSTLISLSWVGFLPLWLAVVVAARDGVVLAGAGAYRWLTGHLEVAPTFSGKLAVFVEFTLVSLVLADAALGLGLANLVRPLVGVAALLAVVSGLHYVVAWTGKGRRVLHQRRAQG
jgi:cardiolipin synthase (CMP-forming)